MENEVQVAEVSKPVGIEGKLAVILTSQETLKDAVGVISATVAVLDEKIDGLIEREAYRAGEAAGTKRTVMLLATCIPVVISLVSLAIGFYVG